MSLALLLLGSAVATACGQTTHVWTALEASKRLPPGPLYDLVNDPANHGALVSGAMFPDGGYSPFVQHDYGETSHWEPFQSAYAAWIVATFPDLEDPVARQHQAFLFGLTAHGIGDQYHDAAYLERSKSIDVWTPSGADTATDVVMGSLVGGLPPNEHWVPYDDLVPIFADVGVDVDRDTMEAGMESLDVAVAWVATVSTDPSIVGAYTSDLPWATGHLLDPAMPGSPQTVADGVVRYWQAWWTRLRGGFGDSIFRVQSGPVTGTWGVPTGPEGRLNLVTVVFGKAVEADSVADRVLATANGEPVEVASWMYYGEHSNALNVEPVDGWPEDATIDVVVEPGVVGLDGWVSAEPVSTRFHTGWPPATATLPVGCTAVQPWSGAVPWLLFLYRRRRSG